MTPYEQNVRIADAATPPAQTAPASGTVPVEGVPAIPEDALILITTRNLVLFPGTVLPITLGRQRSIVAAQTAIRLSRPVGLRSEEHTSELQSQFHLVCRLLLEK